MEKYRKSMKSIVIFLLPALLIYVVFEIIPIICSIYFSFFEWAGLKGVPLKYVGFRNFTSLIYSGDFLISLKNTMRFVVISLFTQLPLGLLFALLLSSYCKGYKIFKTIYFIPMILSVTAMSLMWYLILQPNNGALNIILKSLELENLMHNWLIDKNTALNCIILITAWNSAGFYMIINFAAISSIPDDIFDAALIDGATEIKKVIYITIPLIWESIKISVIMIITGVIKIFDIVFIMTGGGPNGLTNVPATLLYNEAFKYDHYGLGSAISTALFTISIILTVISLKLMQREKIEF